MKNKSSNNIIRILWGFIVFIIISMQKVEVNAETYPITGTCSDNVTWSIDSDGVMIISGTGDLQGDYNSVSDYYELSYKEYSDYITKIVISDGITSICHDAFSYLGNLTEVSIPESVNCMGYWVFAENSKLTAVNIPTQITKIESGTFYGCNSLEYIDLPSKLTYIGIQAFSGCSNLKQIIIPETVKTIDECAFEGCSSLCSVIIPKNVTNLSNYVFSNCSGLTSVNIPDGITSIGNNSFSGCSSLVSMVIPNSVIEIGNGAFSRCEKLESVKLSDSIDKINEYTFSGCSSLSVVEIPHKVTTINSGAFYECSGIISISMSDGLVSIGDSTFWGCTSLKEIVIPKTVNSIGSWAFCDCFSLSNIILSNSITSIESHAFSWCTSLESIDLPDNLEVVDEALFYGCEKLKSVSLPSGIQEIREGAFGGCSIDVLSIPTTISKISDGLSGVTKVVYYGSYCDWFKIASSQFVYYSLTAQSLGHSFDKCSIESIDSEEGCATYTCSNCNYSYKLKYYIDDDECSIYDYVTDSSMSSVVLLDVIIPDTFDGYTVTSVYNDAFSYSKIEGIELPNTVRIIGSYAFSSSSIKWISLSENIESIGTYAFSNCINLSSVSLPNKITSIEQGTFLGCKSLCAIDIPSSVKNVKYEAFRGCSNLASISLKEGINDFGYYAFADCPRLKSVSIPPSVIYIGEAAFGTYYSKVNVKYKPYSDFVLYGWKGTYAETYASQNGITFVEKTGNECNITYILYDGANSATNPSRYNSDEGIIELDNPTKSGYAFEGWYKDASFTNRVTKLDESINEDTILYAKWRLIYKPYGYQVVVDSNFDLRYIVELSDEVKNDSNSYIEFIVEGKTTNVKYSAIEGCYATYIIEVPSKCIGDTISARLYYAGEYYELPDYSIRIYLEKVIENKENKPEYAYARDIAEAILTYAAYAQIYFDYNTDELANSGLNSDHVQNITNREIADNINVTEKSYNNEDFSYLGASLICNSDTYMRIYINNKNNLSIEDINLKYKFYVSGGSNPCTEMVVMNDIIYIDLKDIPAAELNNTYIFVLESENTEFMVKHSPYAYIEDSMNSNNEKLIDLTKALYLYSIAANEYYCKYSMPQ